MLCVLLPLLLLVSITLTGKDISVPILSNAKPAISNHLVFKLIVGEVVGIEVGLEVQVPSNLVDGDDVG